MNIGEANYLLGSGRGYGVIYGLGVRDPQSATLTATVEGGLARVKSTTLGQKYSELVVAESTKAFTASKDTYVFLDTSGTRIYIEKTLNDPKPTQAAVDAAAGVDALYLAKVVTDGTRVVDGGVTDMRSEAPHGEIEAYTFDASFEASEVGAGHLIPLPFSGRVIAAVASVYKAAAATDAGSVTLALLKNGKPANITGGALAIPLSSAIGYRASAYPTALNTFSAGDVLRATTAKTTAGGKVTVTVFLEKLPK